MASDGYNTAFQEDTSSGSTERDSSDTSSSSSSYEDEEPTAKEKAAEADEDVIDTSNLYWNDQFQELMLHLDDSKTWSKLAMLGRDFISVAEMYGRYCIVDSVMWKLTRLE